MLLGVALFFPGMHKVSKAETSTNWTWINPQPTGATLNAADGIDNNNIWTVGAGGTILYYNGVSWEKQFSGYALDLNGVYAVSANNVWAVGLFGAILHYDGINWSLVSSPTTTNLYAIDGFDQNDIWAVGDSGTIIRYNGSNWSAVSTGIQGLTQNLKSVKALDSNNVWVGGNFRLLKYNGTSWSSYSDCSGESLNSIDALSSDNFIAAGYSAAPFPTGASIHPNQCTASEVIGQSYLGLIGHSFKTIKLISQDNYIAAGTDGLFMRYHVSSARWYPDYIGTNLTINALVAFNTTDIYAFGDSGAIFKYNGQPNWAVQTQNGISENLLAIDGYGTNNVWAVGENGTIKKYNTVTEEWDVQISGTTATLNELMFIDATHGWIVGNGGTLLKTEDGINWSSIDSSTTEDLYSIYVVNDQNIYIGGTNETFKYYNGVIWSTNLYDGGDSGTINAIDDGYALGSNVVLKRSGNTWLKDSDYHFDSISIAQLSLYRSNQIYTFGYTDDSYSYLIPGGKKISNNWRLAFDDRISDFITKQTTALMIPSALDLYAGDDNNIWCLGQAGIINYYDGANWDKLAPAGITENITDISLINDNNIWLAVNDGVYNYDGNSLTKVYSMATTANSIYAPSSDDIWVTGLNGYHFNGSTWVEEEQLLNSSSITGLNSQNIWAILGNKIKYYNGTQWTIQYEAAQSITDIRAFDLNNIWAVGYNGLVLKYDGNNWSEIAEFTANTITSVFAKSSSDVYATATELNYLVIYHYDGNTWTKVYTHSTRNTPIYSIDSYGNNIWFVGKAYYRKATMVKYDGENWQSLNTPFYNDFRAVRALDENNVYIAGFGGAFLKYYSPPGASATKLLVKLPGQEFTSGIGITGSPTSQRIGSSFPVEIFAVGPDNKIDTTNTSNINVTSPDATTQNVILQSGSGTVNLTYSSTSAGRTVTATDTGYTLNDGVSSSLVINPGIARRLYCSYTNGTFTAGAPIGPITIGVLDSYGNQTWLDSSKSINLTGEGYNSIDNNGPWTISQVMLPAGDPGNKSTANFYHLTYTEGNNTLTVSSDPLVSANCSFSISAGTVSTKSTVSYDSWAPVGNAAKITVNLVNTSIPPRALDNREITIISSRGKDIITGDRVTDANGVAHLSVSSEELGTSRLYIKADGVFLETQPTINFVPAAVAEVKISEFPFIAGVGNDTLFTTAFYDKYGNLTTNARGNVKITSTDTKAILPEVYALTSKDKGSHQFSINFRTAGKQKIYVQYLDTSTTGSIETVVSPSAASSTTSEIKVDKNSIKSDGKDYATITVILKDSYGNPIEDKKIKLSSSNKKDILEYLEPSNTNLTSILQPAYAATTEGKTNYVGVAKFTIKSNESGERKITASDISDNITLKNSLNIEFQKGFIENLIDDPVVKDVTKNILEPIARTAVAAGIIPVIIQAVAAIPQMLHFLAYLVALISEALGLRRKPKPWGSVFDSLSGKPVDLAVIRLFEANTMKLIATRVTDLAGRFGFTVDPGIYVVSVTKPGYIYPVTKNTLSLLASDEAYYVGAPIQIDKKTENLSLTIPVEPMNTRMSFYSKARVFSRDLSERLSASSIYIFAPLLLLGALSSAVSAYVIGGKNNMYLMYSYLILACFFLLQRSRSSRHHGTVFTQDQESNKLHRLSNAIVYLFDGEFKTLRSQVETDKNGRFTMYVPKGKYYLNCKTNEYVMKRTTDDSKIAPHKKFYEGGLIELKQPGYISVLLKLIKP